MVIRMALCGPDGRYYPVQVVESPDCSFLGFLPMLLDGMVVSFLSLEGAQDFCRFHKPAHVSYGSLCESVEEIAC